VLKVHEDRAVLDAHRDAVDPILSDASSRIEPGGYGLETDFGFGSVSTPRG
jgi:hypothetical protein